MPRYCLELYSNVPHPETSLECGILLRANVHPNDAHGDIIPERFESYKLH